jgi:hypothetical protein
VLAAGAPQEGATLHAALQREALWAVANGADAPEVGRALEAAGGYWRRLAGPVAIQPLRMRWWVFEDWTTTLGVGAPYADAETLRRLEAELEAFDPLAELVTALVGQRVLTGLELRGGRPNFVPEDSWGRDEPSALSRLVSTPRRLHARRVLSEQVADVLARLRAEGLGANLSDLAPDDRPWDRAHLLAVDDLVASAREVESARRLALAGLAFDLGGEAALAGALARFDDARNDGGPFERLVRADGVEVLRSPDPERWYDVRHLDRPLGRYPAVGSDR